MADVEAGQRFPFINLEKAIARANELYTADQRGGEMSVAGAFSVWGYSEKSSGGHQTVAALKAYGLLNAPQPGKLQLSKEAMAYFRDEREAERLKLAQAFARNPTLLRSLWNAWGAHPPADTLARSHLKVDRGLSEQSARAVLNIYKENIIFADLTGSDKIPVAEPEKFEPEHPPMSQAASNLLDRSPSSVEYPKAKGPLLQETFYVDEGPVTLSCPGDLSPESFAEVKAGLEFFLTRAQRRASKTVAQRFGRDPDEE